MALKEKGETQVPEDCLEHQENQALEDWMDQMVKEDPVGSQVLLEKLDDQGLQDKLAKLVPQDLKDLMVLPDCLVNRELQETTVVQEKLDLPVGQE